MPRCLSEFPGMFEALDAVVHVFLSFPAFRLSENSSVTATPMFFSSYKRVVRSHASNETLWVFSRQLATDLRGSY